MALDQEGRYNQLNIRLPLGITKEEWDEYCRKRRLESRIKASVLFGSVASSTKIRGRVIAGNAFGLATPPRCTLRSVIKRWLERISK